MTRRMGNWIGAVALLAILASALAFVSAAPAPPRPPGDFMSSIGMKFVLVPKGKFAMGSPNDEMQHKPDETLHEVEITEPFYLGAHEVTQKQFSKIMGRNPSYFSTT